MKKILSTLMVLTFALIAFNANAQNVNVNSVHRYEISKDNSATSTYKWVVEKSTDGVDWTNPAVLGTDYEVWTSYTDPTSVVIGDFVAGQFEVYVKWLKESEANLFYRVRVIEADASAGCYDVAINEKIQPITVAENNFTVTLAYKDKVGGAGGTDCAVDGNNTINFTVTKSGGAFGSTVDVNDKWNFQYEVNVNGTGWVKGTVDMIDGVVEGNNVKLVPVEKGTDTHTLALVYSIPTGSDDYVVEVRVIDARDGYGAIATTGLNVPATATIHKVPTTGSFVTD